MRHKDVTLAAYHTVDRLCALGGSEQQVQLSTTLTVSAASPREDKHKDVNTRRLTAPTWEFGR